MRALGFFFAVFLSMLSVFLIATGEVRRWFQPSPASPTESIEAAAAMQPPGKNLLEFDFYDVEEGRRKFSMRAHLSQGEFQVESKLDQIPSLTLENGTLEVPFPEVEGDAPSRAGKLVVEFESAVYERGTPGAQGEKPDFQVFLRRGKGTLEDGTVFHFEDLVFTEDRKKDPKDAQPIRFSSSRPVSVENGSFELASPSGFEGRIVSNRIDRFTFHAPVSALIDPANASALPVELPLGSREVAPGGSGLEASRKPPEKLAVTSQGPLDLEFIEAGETSVARAVIRFQNDVKLFPLTAAPGRAASLGDGAAPGAALQSLARPEGTRLECEHLQIDLEDRGDELVPVRALASMVPANSTAAPPAPVRIIIQKDPSQVFRIEGDSLEWLLRQGADREAPASAAVLHGKPRITGSGLDLHAGGAVFHVEENRLLLSDVRGAIEKSAIAEKKPGKKERQPRAPSLPDLGPIPDEPGGLLDPRAEAPLPDEATASRAPAHWDLVADEAELLFETGEGSGSRELSRLVARSDRPDGVEIRGREKPADGTAAAPTTPSVPIVITGKTLTYAESAKLATLEGTEAVKPRFAQGMNLLESRRIHVHVEEGVAHFEEEVRGKVEEAGMLVQKDRNGAHPETSPGSPTEPRTLEIEAESLAIRIEEKGKVQYIRARGPSQAVRLLVRSSSAAGSDAGQDGWWRFVAPDLFWDQAGEIAQLAAGGAEARPRIEFEEGSIEAGRIRFDRAHWKAELSQGVTLTLEDRGSAKAGAADPSPIVVSAGRAEVEFFPEFDDSGADSTGPLRRLSVVKRLRAFGGAPVGPANAGEAIRIQGPAFAARAEECEWDAERRELRFRGNGLQEIEILQDEMKGPIRAREIVFDASRKLVTLSGAGGVTGRLVQARAGDRTGEVPGAALDPASHRSAAAETKDLVWDFETSILEIALRETADGFELSSVNARDKVHLENVEMGAQLLGDDLHYDHATQRIRIFSPNGRPQTLIKNAVTRKGESPAGSAADGGPEKIHKITSQEIWVILYKNPAPASEEPRDWVLATFEKDVIGTFYVPPQGELPRSGDVTDIWKMVSERLAVHIDPSKKDEGAGTAPPRGGVRWAVASGNVDFSSGTVRATCDRAIYEEAASRLTLLGAPARLSRENRRVFEDPEIRLRKVGTEIEIEHSGRGKPTPPAIPPEMEAPPLGRR